MAGLVSCYGFTFDAVLLPFAGGLEAAEVEQGHIRRESVSRGTIVAHERRQARFQFTNTWRTWRLALPAQARGTSR